MPRGHEDWFINTQAIGKATQDVGELAARLGVPYSWTRSGKVIYTDGFEGLLSPWGIISDTDEGGAVIVTDVSFRGSNCLKLTPKATSLYYAGIQKVIPYFAGGRIGFEAIVGGSAESEVIAFEIGVRKDNILTYYGLYYYFATNELKYNTAASARISILDLPGNIGAGGRPEILLKMVVDINKDEYAYFRMNDNVVSLAGIKGYTYGDTGINKLQPIIRAEDSNGTQKVVWVDDVTITIDEP